MILDDDHWSLEEAWRRVCHDHDEFCHSFNLWGNEENVVLSNVWEPPEVGKVKLNTDGSYREREDHVGFGGLLRDHNGDWIKGFKGHGVGGNAFQAETLALKEGIKLAWSLGFKNVLCEVDCANLVKVIEDDDASLMHPEVAGSKRLMEEDWEIKLRRIKRDSNVAADRLAKAALCMSMYGVSVLNYPEDDLDPIVLRDQLRIA